MAGVLDVGRTPAQLELQHLRPPTPQLQAVEGGLLAALHRLHGEPATRIIAIIFLNAINAISSCLLSTNSTTTMERVDTTAVFYLCCVALHLAVVFPTNFSLIHSNLVLLEPPAAASLG